MVIRREKLLAEDASFETELLKMTIIDHYSSRLAGRDETECEWANTCGIAPKVSYS